MIKSMTGFGRCEVTENNRKFTVEMKAVNHRYLEVNMKFPKKISVFESSIRNVMKQYIERGKVDVFITLEDYNAIQENVRYNSNIAHEYMNYLNQMSEEFGMDNDVRISSLSRYPDVFTMEEANANDDEIWKELEKCVRGACEKFVESRVAEGENLKNDLIMKLDGMKDQVALIEERSPQVVEEYRRRILDKVNEVLSQTNAEIDEGRIVTEVTLFADKICVDEETVRLKSHIESMKQCLEAGGSCGRKLDFIAQEMNREANTTLSKANDLALADTAIEIKTEIEKIREQVQNIE